MSGKRLIIAAGGTGGHVFPAQALAEKMSEVGWEVHFITESRGQNWTGFSSGVQVHEIQTGNLGQGSLFKKLLNAFPLFVGVLQSLIRMYRVRPQGVIGFGGYPSFPVLLASLLYPTKRFVHEQNAVLGRVNRWLYPLLDKVALSVPLRKSIQKAVLTGMPVRAQVLEGKDQPYPDIQDELVITVLGGSQGAGIFSEVLPLIFGKIAKSSSLALKITQQCRPEFLDETRRLYEKNGLKPELTPFIDSVSEVLLKTHLVISRAGASSLAEVTVLGRPSVLVPYPWAMDDHQTENALVLKDAEAAWVVDEAALKRGKLEQVLQNIVDDPKQLRVVSQKARRIAPVKATQKLKDLIEKEIEG